MSDYEPVDASPDPSESRDERGRFLPAHSGSPATRWGPGNPPPKSPGRPKKGAWVKELEGRVSDPRIRQALADRLLKIALKGPDAASLRALQEIEDRTGEAVKLRVEGVTEDEVTARLCFLLGLLAERLPREFHQTISEVTYEAMLGPLEDRR